jgi:acetyl-CoA C-acetyltransferase
MREVVIVSAARSAGGKFGGSLQNVPAPELGAAVIREAVKRAGISPEVVEQTIFGNAWQAGVGPRTSRRGCPSTRRRYR